jgi:ankyrin repeat protein
LIFFAYGCSQEKLEDDLYVAFYQNDVKKIKDILPRLKDPKKVLTKLLCIASYNHNNEMIPALIANGADVNGKDSFNRTPLQNSLSKNGNETAIILLRNGADPNLGDKEFTSMERAISKKDLVLIKELIKYKVNINERLEGGYTFLLHAAEGNNLEMAKILLEAGADAKARKTFNGYTPLMIAASENYIDMVKLLAESNPETIKLEDKDGQTAWGLAKMNNNLKVADLLQKIYDSYLKKTK